MDLYLQEKITLDLPSAHQEKKTVSPVGPVQLPGTKDLGPVPRGWCWFVWEKYGKTLGFW